MQVYEGWIDSYAHYFGPLNMRDVLVEFDNTLEGLILNLKSFAMEDKVNIINSFKANRRKY